MKKPILLLIVIALSLSPLAAEKEKKEPSASLRALVAAERAFAQSSETAGTKRAFLEYLAPDSVIFRPGPVPGLAWFRESKDVSGWLSWEPSYVELSRSKDMGYSVGPFQWSQLKGGKAQHGTFVSVWEVKENGEWKVILDHGVQYKQPARQPAEPMLVEDRGESGGVERAAKRALLVTDDTLGRALETEDPVALYREHTAADFLLLRSDMQPVAGRDEAIKAMGTEAPMFASIEMAGAGISKGGDLAFTYGIAKLAKPGGASFDATYVRIWRKGTGDSWDLALELATPLPNPGDKKKS